MGELWGASGSWGRSHMCLLPTNPEMESSRSPPRNSWMLNGPKESSGPPPRNP
ncbi:Hypothetical protein FKW44_024314 [Caligus rogercresseyi]|uniref:Uncharacterized protein n=1 Tax=Caligus rogercresseyi TaxID=217165 RepID=A0A7T8GMS5_CALRO|nr:Hypothetical protein FKW44_024314 [Caligus rogercresseyi]